MSAIDTGLWAVEFPPGEDFVPSPRCRCSHIQAHHYTDRRGRVACRSAACGCAEFRPGGNK